MPRSTSPHTLEALRSEAVILRELADLADTRLRDQPWLSDDAAEVYAILHERAACAEATVMLA